MLKYGLTLLLAMVSLTAQAATTESALTCDDFNPTQEALDRFPDLIGACETVVERDGQLYGLFRAVVRRATSRSVTLYLPATDRTFSVEPESDARVLIGTQKVRPRELQRGQEIRIYLAASAFATPDVQEIALITDAEVVLPHPVVPTPALPTTASPWPNLAAFSAVLLLVGLVSLGYRRRSRQTARRLLSFTSAAVCVLALVPLWASAESGAKPARVVSAVIQRAAIVESVNKETRELKLLDSQGNRFSVVADARVRNFDQIKPRDRIVADYMESVAVVIEPAGTDRMPEDAAAIAVAPAGDKPGVEGVETHLLYGTIESINRADRLVTVSVEDQVRTLKVPDDGRLALVNVGDQVRLQVTVAVAINVVSPDQ